MDKRKLLDQFAALIEADLNVVITAAKVAHEAATHSESKAEDQYDTRGLEASYLAGAQADRASSLQSDLHLFKTLEIKKFGKKDAITATAVVTLDCDGKESYYLLMPCSGGLSLQFEGKRIQVITPKSPIGEAILGKKVGDQIAILIQRQVRDYDIVNVK